MSSPSRRWLIHGATLVDAAGSVSDGWLVAEDGLIIAIGTASGWTSHATGAEVVDGAGCFVTPGFIDLHCHGGGGYSNEDGADAIIASAASHRSHGTTRSVVSLVASPVPELEEKLRAVAALCRTHPQILGSHLEGPFLSQERRGAHDAAFLADPNEASVAALLSAANGTLRQVTIDPRRRQAEAAIRAFVDAGVVVAIGHTEANYNEARAAFARGATLLTHAFNAMPGLRHRAPGPVLAAVDSPGAVLEIILDGEHVHPRIAAMIFAAAPSRVALVTDAMAAAGSGDGEYRLGSLPVTVRDGRAQISGTQTLAGSTATLDLSLRIGIDAGIDAVVLVEAITLTTARVLGLHTQLGRLRPGFFSDLVLFNNDWTVISVQTSPRCADTTRGALRPIAPID